MSGVSSLESHGNQYPREILESGYGDLAGVGPAVCHFKVEDHRIIGRLVGSDSPGSHGESASIVVDYVLHLGIDAKVDRKPLVDDIATVNGDAFVNGEVIREGVRQTALEVLEALKRRASLSA